MGDPTSWTRRAALFAPLGMAALGISAELLWGGRTDVGGTFAFFLGRFHPLIVHLPIGGLILLSLFEVLPGRAAPSREWRKAVDALLVATVVSAAGALVLGHLLAQEGGVAAGALAQHRALAATAGVLVAVALWVHQSAPVQQGKRLRYRVALGSSLLVLSGAAHIGGTLSRGESYLSKYAPGWLAPLLGGGPRPVPPPMPAKRGRTAQGPRLFTNVVLPILLERCGDCHGTEVTKAQFSVLSLEALKQGGKSGSALDVKEPMKSLLWLRIEEPLSHDEHMPPADETQLTPGEHAVLEFWLQQGAAGDPDLGLLLPSAEAWPLLTRGLTSPSPAKEPLPTATQPTATQATATQPTESNSDAQPKTNSNQVPRSPAETDPAPGSSGAPPLPEPQAPAPSVAAPTGASAFAILRSRCSECHGTAKQKGSLRLDSMDAIWRGGKEGPAINADAPAQSPLLVRIALPIQDDEHMPPAGHNQLTTPERDTLRQFVMNQAPHAKPAAASQAASAPAASSGQPSNHPDEPLSQPTQEPSGSNESPAAQAEPAPPAAPPELPDWSRAAFERHVLPALSRSCTLCHDDTAASGKLRLDSLEAAFRGGRSGPAIVPGRPDKSVLVERISLPAGHDDRMPPADEPPLPAADAQLIRSWITHALDANAPAEFSAPTEKSPRSKAEPAADAPTEPPRTAPGPGQGGFLGCAWAELPERTDWALIALIALTGCALRSRRTSFGPRSGTRS